MTSLIADGSTYDSQEGAALEALRARLHRDFDDAVGPEEVDRALDTARQHFDGSRIRTFVPILAERRAVEDLARVASVRAQSSGTPAASAQER